MQTASFNQALQNFVWAISCEKNSDDNAITADGQEQALDYLMVLMQYCVQFDSKNIPKGLHLHPEFFAFPSVEKFYADLFVNLDDSLFHKAEAVFLRGFAFVIEYIGPPKSREVMHELLGKLQERFPALKEVHDKAISTFIEEFFLPTLGEFLDQHKDAEKYLQTTFPALHELFIAPLSTAPFRERKLFNFYCNPWVYQRIMNYLAYYARLSLPIIKRDLLEMPLQWLEGRLQIIRAQTNAESWLVLTRKTQEALTHSEKLESFAMELAGLVGEIKTSAQFIKDACFPEDTLIFLPELKDRPNCDLLVTRNQTGNHELIECKAKTPRHGLEEKTAGEAQIWDDFITNFSEALYSYHAYFLENVQTPMGCTECFPLLGAYEGSGYAQALPLIEDIPSAIGNIPLNRWTAEQKVGHLLRAFFLRPLILDTCCGPLPSDEDCFAQRQRETETAIKDKKWIISILNKATKQLEEAYNRLTAEGQVITKLHVALDLNLSYRLLSNPFSYNDGNIAEVAEKALHDTFEPYKADFAKRNLDLCLLIIRT
jgi:hypothetical protein